MKNVIYMAGIRYGDESDWELMWDQYLRETDATEKGKLLHALGQTRDSNLLARYALCMIIVRKFLSLYFICLQIKCWL